jgi:molecular chaperone HtpG
MVHSVYQIASLPARADLQCADACEKLRYEAISTQRSSARTQAPHHSAIDPQIRRLTIEDNGIGMSRDEMVEALGTIARSGTKAFMERLRRPGRRGCHTHRAVRRRLLLRFHGGRAGRCGLPPGRHAEAFLWSSDGKGSYTIAPADPAEAPRGARG